MYERKGSCLHRRGCGRVGNLPRVCGIDDRKVRKHPMRLLRVQTEKGNPPLGRRVEDYSLDFDESDVLGGTGILLGGGHTPSR